MSTREEIENMKQRFQHLLRDAAITDDEICHEVWDQHVKLKEKYSMDGDPLYWLAAAILLEHLERDREINMIKLFKSSRLSLQKLTFTLRKLIDMKGLTNKHRLYVSQLEEDLNYSQALFVQFDRIFMDVFADVVEESPGRFTSQQQQLKDCYYRKMSGSSGAAHFGDVMHYAWLFFLWVSHQPCAGVLNKDLLDLYGLMLCCVKTVIVDLMRDDSAQVFVSSKFPKTANIRNLLCDRYNALHAEVKIIEEKWFVPFLKQCIDSGVLRGVYAEAPSSTTIFTTMVTKDNFEFNMSQFTSFYLEHRVKPKLFDERVFLACQGADKPHVIASGDLTSSKIYAEMKKRFERYRDQASGNAGSAGKEEIFGTPLGFGYSPLKTRTNWFERTPLTAKGFIEVSNGGNKRGFDLPGYMVPTINDAMKSFESFSRSIQDRTDSPSDFLKKFVAMYCEKPVLQFLEQTLEKSKSKFIEAWLDETEDYEGRVYGKIIAERRWLLITIYFYRLVDSLTLTEATMVREKQAGVLKKGVFDHLLMEADFLNTLLMVAIETVLYLHISKRAFPWAMKVIRLRATAPARYMEFIIRSVPIALREIVKHVHHVEEMLLQELIWKSDSDIWLLMEKYTEKDSPPLPSFHDVAPLSALDDGTGPKSPLRSARVNQMREFIEKFTAGATDTAFITDSASALEWNAKTGKLVIPTSPKELQNRPSKPITPLTALMRKVYSLAAIRLNDLCDRLEISTPSGDLAYYQRLWNALELIIRQRPELLQDRNIDQIIMSTVYIMGLINPKHKKSFQEIMNAYRAQPQASSSVYRHVLISRDPSGGEKRDDIIKFYNTVFMAATHTIVRGVCKLETLQVMPKVATQATQRYQVSHNERLFTSPIKNGNINTHVMPSLVDNPVVGASPVHKFMFSPHQKGPLRAETRQINMLLSPVKNLNRELNLGAVNAPNAAAATEKNGFGSGSVSTSNSAYGDDDNTPESSSEDEEEQDHSMRAKRGKVEVNGRVK